MTMLGTYLKQPAEVLDYDVDYSEWIDDADAVISATTSVDQLGLTVTNTTVINPIVKVWLSGGTNGITYKVTVTTTTQDGRIKQDEFRVKVKDI